MLFRHLICASAFFLASCDGFFAPAAVAQEANSASARGYITAVHLPAGFDVNSEHVVLQPDVSKDNPLRDAVRVGAYVDVIGANNRSTKTVTADSVLFRDDWDKKLSGFGVIDKILTMGQEPVFRADGYKIRVISITEVSFKGDLKNLADVGTGIWLKYEGKRDKSGVLIASKAEFVSAKLSQDEVTFAQKQNDIPSQGALLDADGNLQNARAKVRLSDAGGYCGWHRVPADQSLQEKVRRLGMSVIPGYQKQLKDDDPSKIQFRFYVVDEKQIRSELVCKEGLILVPTQVVERLRNDDQMAALLADGVAFSLQLQEVRVTTNKSLLISAEVADDVFLIVDPLDFLIVNTAVAPLAMRPIAVKMQEQRGRIALALVADAGYDPYQAPEVWRLLAPKSLPKNLNSLKYPDRSGYQLGILNLQYNAAAPAVGASSAVPASAAQNQ
jgi:hypothetical protein